MSATPKTNTVQSDDAVTAGRGFLFITSAKLYFLLTSTLINIGLPRLLKDPARFGDFKVVNTLISIVNMVMITGTIQTVAKLVSENEDSAGAVRSRAFKLQAVVGGSIFVAVLLLADPICSVLLRDPSLAPYLRVAAIIVIAYAFYAIFVGLLNGLKRFKGQAALDITFSTLKTGFIIVLVLAGYSVMGAFAGFAAAAVLIVGVAAFTTRRIGRSDRPVDVDGRRMAAFMLQIMAYTFVVNMLLQVDVLFIKGMKLEPFREDLRTAVGQARMALATAALPSYLGSGADALTTAFATEATSRLAGFFGAMKNVSLIPYQAIISITFVIFPLISKATFGKDIETARRYIRQTFRTSLVLVAALCVVLLSNAEPLVDLLFGHAYTVGAEALVILLCATVLYALLFVGNTIITGAGSARTALVIGLVTLAANMGAVAGLLSVSGPWKSALDAAAWGGALSLGLGFVLCMGTIALRFKTLIPVMTLVRVVGLSIALWFAAPHLPSGGPILLIVRMAVIGILFLVGLWLTGEVTKEDRDAVMRIVARRRSKA